MCRPALTPLPCAARACPPNPRTPTIQAIFDSADPEYDLDFDGDQRDPIIGVTKPTDDSEPKEISSWSITKVNLTVMDGSEGGKAITPPAFMLCSADDATPPGTLESAKEKAPTMPMISTLFEANAKGKMEVSIMIPAGNTELVDSMMNLHIGAGEQLGGDHDQLKEQLAEGDKDLTIECGDPGVEKTDDIIYKFMYKHGDGENWYFIAQVFANTPISLFVLNEDKTDFARNALGHPELVNTTLEDLPDGGKGLRIHAMLNIEGTSSWNVYKNKVNVSSLRLKLRTALCYPKELAPHKDTAVAELVAGYGAAWAADAEAALLKTQKSKAKAALLKANSHKSPAGSKSKPKPEDKKKRKLEELARSIEAAERTIKVKVPKGSKKAKSAEVAVESEDDEPQEP